MLKVQSHPNIVEFKTDISSRRYVNKKTKMATDIFGRYDSLRIIASGTYGIVYEHNSRAIKEQLKDKDYGLTCESIREASILLHLTKIHIHPNVIRLLSVALDETRIYIVAPLAEGTLRDKFRGPSISFAERIECCFQLVSGLAYCHVNNIIHRDLKPENILFSRNEVGEIIYQLADFGMSRSYLSIGDSGLTNGVTSLHYRAPEILIGGKYDFKCDVWSLGCIIYEIFTNRFFCQKFNEREQFSNILRLLGTANLTEWDDYKKLGKLKDCRETHWGILLSEKVEIFLRKLLVINPNRRFSSYEILQDSYFDFVSADRKSNLQLLTQEERILLTCQFTKPDKEYFVEENKIILFSWIDKFAQLCELHSPGTSTATYLIIGRYLRIKWLQEGKIFLLSELQLIGIAALLVTTKMLLPFNISTSTISSICCSYKNKLYTRGHLRELSFGQTQEVKEILRSEDDLVTTLSYDLNISTASHLLNLYGMLYSKIVQEEAHLYILICYWSSLSDTISAEYLALSCLWIACSCSNEPYRHRKVEKEILKIVCAEIIRLLMTYRDYYNVRMFVDRK